MRMFTAINKQPWVQTSHGNLTLCRSRSWKFLCTHLTVDETDTLILTSNCTVCSHSLAQWVSNQYWLTDIEQLQSIKLYFSVLTNSIDYKISYLHTHTAVTCLSLHHLGYLVVNWSNSDIQTDGQTWAGQICGCKGTKIPPLLQLLAYVFSSHVAAVLTGWRTRRTVMDKNVHRWVISERYPSSSHVPAVFKCQYLLNGKQHVTTFMTLISIFYGKGFVCK